MTKGERNTIKTAIECLDRGWSNLDKEYDLGWVVKCHKLLDSFNLGEPAPRKPSGKILGEPAKGEGTQ